MSQVNLLPPDILQGQRYRRLTLTVLAAGAIVLFAGAHTQWGADSLHLDMND